MAISDRDQEPHDSALFARRYRAINSRDARFDGQFITAVKSTMIYCRPSCPARTPKAENVTFYLTSAAAHEAGFRACKRCLPEATPGTPEWSIRHDITARAMRLIADGEIDRAGVEGLASHLGLSPRHLTRTLVAELGAGPLALARARRAQLARELLVSTPLPLIDVAFAAGFGSVRQFNDTVREVFAVAPSAIRARRQRPTPATPMPADPMPTVPGPAAPMPAAPMPAARIAVAPRTTAEPESGTEEVSIKEISTDEPLTDEHSVSQPIALTLSLPVRHPFDARGVFDFLAARTIPGVELADASDPAALRYARTLRLPGGPAAFEVQLTHIARGWNVTATLEVTSLADVPAAVARIRRLLDLDADAAGIDAALTADPALAPLVRATPGIRVPGTVDPHELVIRAIVGQQISVVAAHQHLAKLAAHAGSPYHSRFAGLTTLFPTSAQIVAAVPHVGPADALDPDRLLRLPRRSSNAVRAAAAALASGELIAHIGADRDALTQDLLALPGVGPWTAAYIALRVLGDPDSWMIGDVALIAGARAIGVLPLPAVGSPSNTPATHRELAARAVIWAPWRSYASMHLWQAALPTFTLPDSDSDSESESPR